MNEFQPERAKATERRIWRAIAFWLALTVTITASVTFCTAKAAELWLGGNLTHLSQLDAGYPFNENHEDSVDHIGLSAEIRTTFHPDVYLYIGLSAGTNTILTDCACDWNDGGAEIDTKVEFGFKWKAVEW